MLSVEKVTSQHRSLEISSYRKKAANDNSEQATNRTSLNDMEVSRLPTNADSISAVTSSFLTLAWQISSTNIARINRDAEIGGRPEIW